jgi:RNA polymerase sigma factor (sigma-70 family)
MVVRPSTTEQPRHEHRRRRCPPRASRALSREALFRENLALAYYVGGKRSIPPAFDRDDVIQAGLIALWEASRTYNPARGKFSMHAAIRLRDHISRYLQQRRNKPLLQTPRLVGVDGVVEDALAQAPAREDDQDAAVDVRQVLGQLLGEIPSRHREAVELRFGLRTGKPAPLSEVGEKLGVTRERARQMIGQALKGLRRAARRLGVDESAP